MILVFVDYKILTVTTIIASLFLLLAAAVVLFIFAVHLLAAFAGGLLPASLFILRWLLLALFAFIAVFICHNNCFKMRHQYSANNSPHSLTEVEDSLL